MATIAKLDVLLGLDDGAFQRGMEKSRKSLNKWGKSFRSAGKDMTQWVTTPIAGSGVMMIKWAADLEQTMGATEQLWGKNSDEIIKWSESANTSMGMTQDEALRSSNRFNAMFKQIEGGEGAVKDMSMGFTQLSADLSAMWGGSSIEASDALTAALRGNYEGLDKYNINLTEAMVNEEAMNVARAEGRDEITESDKVQARYNLIMEQSTDAQGQFARETDTTSGKLAILRARVIDAATRFGKLLLPYVNKAADAFSKLVTFVEGLSDTQRKWVIVIAAAAAALGPLLIVIGLLLPGIGALVTVIGLLLSPIGLVVAAIALLAGGLIYAYTHFEGFKEVVDTAASAVKDFLKNAVEKLIAGWNELTEAFESGGIMGVITRIAEAIRNIDWGALIQGGWNVLYNGIQLAWEAVKDIPWMSIIGKIADFGLWLAGRVAAVDWGEVIGKIADFSVWLGKKVASVDWGALIGKIADFAVWLGEKVAAVDWTEVIGKIADFGVWLGGKIGELDWPTGAEILAVVRETVEAVLGVGGLQKTNLILGMGANTAGQQAGDAAEGIKNDIRGGAQGVGGSGNVALPGTIPMRLPGWLQGSPFDTKGSNSIYTALDKAVAATQTAWGTIVGATNTGVTTSKGSAQSGFTAIQSAVASKSASAASSASSYFSSIANTVSSQSGNANRSATSQFSSMSSSSLAKFLGMQAGAAVQMALMASTATTKGKATMSNMTGALAGGMARVAVTLLGLPNAVRSAGSSAAEIAYNAGANISIGFANGMLAYLGQVRSAANAMVNEADRAVRAKARIASPSKLFERYGEYVAMGFEGGIRNGTAGVAHAAAAMVGVPSLTSPAAAGGQVINIITLEPGRWKEFLAKAENGDQFARNFSGESDMMEGLV